MPVPLARSALSSNSGGISTVILRARFHISEDTVLDTSMRFGVLGWANKNTVKAFDETQLANWLASSQNRDMIVSVTEAKNKLTQLLTAVEKGERVTIERHGRAIAEIVKPSLKKAPKFGTLKGIVQMTPDQFREATRPMTDEEVDAFLDGRY